MKIQNKNLQSKNMKIFFSIVFQDLYSEDIHSIELSNKAERYKVVDFDPGEYYFV